MTAAKANATLPGGEGGGGGGGGGMRQRVPPATVKSRASGDNPPSGVARASRRATGAAHCATCQVPLRSTFMEYEYFMSTFL